MFAYQFAAGLPGTGFHIMAKSFDGGRHSTRAQRLFAATDLCNAFEPSIGRCVEDGIAGAPDDLGPSPSVDIANGAPTGADATNQTVNSWADGRDGLNHEHVMFSTSTNGGTTWTAPRTIETAGDRGYYAAPAISPNGTDVWVVYNAFTTPFRNDTSSPRNLVGVVKHADVSPGGTVGAFGQIHRSPGGDPRGSSQNKPRSRVPRRLRLRRGHPDVWSGRLERHPSRRRLPGDRRPPPGTTTHNPADTGTSRTSTAGTSPSESTAYHGRVEERCQRHEERRIIQQRVHPSQLLGQRQQLRRQHRIPQRRPLAYRSKHDDLDPFSPKGSRSSFRPPTATPMINTPTFRAT
jgi:hypothetical protein